MFLCLKNKDELNGVVEFFAKDKVDYQRISVNLIGKVSIGSESVVFLNEEIVLKNSGRFEGRSSETFEFSFSGDKFVKKYDSYKGVGSVVFYSVEVRVNSKVEDKKEIEVLGGKEDGLSQELKSKVEIGIEDCLQLELKLEKSVFSVEESVVGELVFNLVKLRIKSVELQLIVKEKSKTKCFSEVLYRFEILDGEPRTGEKIPIRLFLSGVNSVLNRRKAKGSKTRLSRSFSNICDVLSVKHYLSLVLYDNSNKKFFKEQEIRLF